MSLPVAWGSRTNGSAPENAVKSERPGDWTHATIQRKYRPEDLEVPGETGAPLGWGKRSNTKTIEELAQSTSAAVVAVAEVHERHSAPSSIFRGTEGPNAPQAAASAHTAPSSSSSHAPAPPLTPAPAPAFPAAPAPSVDLGAALLAVQERQEQQHNLLTMLAGVVIKMDARMGAMEAALRSLESGQGRLLSAIEETQGRKAAGQGSV